MRLTWRENVNEIHFQSTLQTLIKSWAKTLGQNKSYQIGDTHQNWLGSQMELKYHAYNKIYPYAPHKHQTNLMCGLITYMWSQLIVRKSEVGTMTNFLYKNAIMHCGCPLEFVSNGCSHFLNKVMVIFFGEHWKRSSN